MNHLAIFFLESCWECVRRRTDILNEFLTIFPELTGNVLSAEVKLYLLHAVYGVVIQLMSVWSSGVPLQ